MIKLENEQVYGWESAIRGARNPKNSWDRMDSEFYKTGHYESCELKRLGPNDYKLLTKLAKAGPDHGKFMRMITVYVDITAPLYWWKEFDTYKVGTVANSCSTMHKIHDKKFELSDFSCEHLFGCGGPFEDDTDCWINGYLGAELPSDTLEMTVCMLNKARELYIKTKDKKYWWQMIQLLPSSYNQKRTIMLNYAVLKNMYEARKAHKLDEWHDFCDWIKTLPYSELITGNVEKE